MDGKTVINDEKRMISEDLLNDETFADRPECMKKLIQLLQQYGKFHNNSWNMYKLVLLKSEKGCKAQREHSDGAHFSKKNEIASVVFSIMNGTKLVIKGKEHKIPPGAALVFAGCLPHNGAAYDRENIRFHAYYAKKQEHVLADGVGKIIKCSLCGERVESLEYHKKKSAHSYILQKGLKESYSRIKQDYKNIERTRHKERFRELHPE